jgi:hypothetical protein
MKNEFTEKQKEKIRELSREEVRKHEEYAIPHNINAFYCLTIWIFVIAVALIVIFNFAFLNGTWVCKAKSFDALTFCNSMYNENFMSADDTSIMSMGLFFHQPNYDRTIVCYGLLTGGSKLINYKYDNKEDCYNVLLVEKGLTGKICGEAIPKKCTNSVYERGH